MNDLHYAIVVGINNYPGIGPLTGARADAEEFAKWLIHPDGGALPKDNVRKVLLTDAEEVAITKTHGARPTHDEIDYALEYVRDELKKKLEADPACWERSRIYLYFAGHGFAPQGGEGALLLANADPDSLDRNIEISEYRKWCTACAWARDVVIFADCCRTRFRSYAKGWGPRIAQCEAPWGGKSSRYLIGYGSALAKDTYEIPEPDQGDKARGYFTRALLEGLQAAKRDESGAIPSANLATFVTKVLFENTQNEPFPQEAQIEGWQDTENAIRFGSSLAPARRNVTILLPVGYAGAARVLTSDNRELAKWNRKSSTWTVELEDGLYEVAGDITFADKGLFRVVGGAQHVSL